MRMPLTLLACCLLSTSAKAQELGNLFNLSFTGDGRTLSGAQLLEQSERQTAQAKFSVGASDRGDASYSFPIPLPAALLAPSVSLNHSSTLNDHTWLARGWSLGHGLVTMDRVTRKPLDAYPGLTEVYKVSGGGFDGTIWLDDATDLWHYSSSGSIEAEITKYTESGQPVWRLSRGGVTTILRARNDVNWWSNNEPVSFYPEHVQDASGNTIVLDWEGTRLESITYGGYCTGSECVPTDAHLRVRFVYGVRDFSSRSYDDGVLDLRDAWLDAVVVESDPDKSGWVTTNEYLVVASPAAVPSSLPAGELGHGRLLMAVEAKGYEIDAVGTVGLPIHRRLATFDYSRGDAPTEEIVYYAAPPFLDFTATFPRLIEDGDMAETQGSRPVVDYSGDGLPDFIFSYFQSEVDGYDADNAFWMRRDWNDGPENNNLTYQADGDREQPMPLPTDTTGVPVSQTVFCQRDRAHRYGREVYVDLDGDGLLDRIASDGVLESITSIDGAGSNKCNSNTYQDATWTVDYAFARFDSERWTGPSEGLGFPSEGMLPWTLPPRLPTEPEWTVLNAWEADILHDGKVELVDMNGDGWMDIVEVVFDPNNFLKKVLVRLKNPDRTKGWEGAQDWYQPGMPLRAHTTTVLENDLHEESLYGTEYMVGRAENSRTKGAFRDMNGDGLPDYVHVCPDDVKGDDPTAIWWCSPRGADGPATWSVWFNTGSGFGDEVLWDLPGSGGIAYITEVDEGLPSVIACSGSMVQGGPVLETPLPPLTGITAGESDGWDLTDANGDGVPDIFGSFHYDLTGLLNGDCGPGARGVVLDDCPDLGDPLDAYQSWFDDNLSIFQPQVDVFGPAATSTSEVYKDIPGTGGGIFSGTCSRSGEEFRRGQRVLASLMDWDSDGRLDYVNADAGLWYLQLPEAVHPQMS